MFKGAITRPPREDLKLYVLNGFGENWNWREIALQIDPVDEAGRLEFFADDVPWTKEAVGLNDRLTFRVEEFGAKRVQAAGIPCMASQIHELRDEVTRSKYAYLVHCTDDNEHARDEVVFLPPVRHDGAKRLVTTQRYSYQYQARNHLMFDQIVLDPDASGQQVKVSQHSRQEIRADFKNFFTMTFTDRDVSSQLLDIRPGPVALVGRLSFFLRLLFFKIDLQLNTAVSFYEDSVHVPMTLNLPLSPQRYVHPGSGIFFSWESDLQTIRWDRSGKLIPSLNAEAVLQGPESLAKAGLSYCLHRFCSFVMRGWVGDQGWSLEFNLERTLVEKGFFPMFVEDANAFKRELKWQRRPSESSSRVGVYLEAAGLEAGEHAYDLWIKVADRGDEQGLNRACPHRVRVIR